MCLTLQGQKTKDNVSSWDGLRTSSWPSGATSLAKLTQALEPSATQWVNRRQHQQIPCGRTTPGPDLYPPKKKFHAVTRVKSQTTWKKYFYFRKINPFNNNMLMLINISLYYNYIYIQKLIALILLSCNNKTTWPIYILVKWICTMVLPTPKE